MSIIEAQASSDAIQLLELVEAGIPERTLAWLRKQNPNRIAWLCLALAKSYLESEADRAEAIQELSPLRNRAAQLDAANRQLFEERRTLTEKLEQSRAEWQRIQERRAS